MYHMPPGGDRADRGDGGAPCAGGVAARRRIATPSARRVCRPCSNNMLRSTNRSRLRIWAPSIWGCAACRPRWRRRRTPPRRARCAPSLPPPAACAQSMFLEATAFNHPSIGSWDVSAVQNGFYEMFRDATAFNQPLAAAWDVTSIGQAAVRRASRIYQHMPRPVATARCARGVAARHPAPRAPRAARSPPTSRGVRAGHVPWRDVLQPAARRLEHGQFLV